ncbi:MAG: hypothetical protein WBG37_21025 [Desulfobacterales bacterium]
MAAKLPIHGLKLSTEQILLQMPAGVDSSSREIFKRLAAAKINLSCVVLDDAGNGLAGSCCLDSEDQRQVKELLAGVTGAWELTSAVGTLTVFPHRYRLDLLATALRSLARKEISVLGIASSLSALIFILPYRQLDVAAEAICAVAQLPDNHAPFRPQFRVRQV